MEMLHSATVVKGYNSKTRLYVCGDWHVGARGCDYDMLNRTARHILKDKDGYVMVLGDMAECIKKADRRSDSNAIHPMFTRDLGNLIGNQERYCRKLLKPLAEAGKILCLMDGNHERTFELNDDVSITRNLCEDLGVPYGGYSCVYSWTFRLHASQKTKPIGRRIVIHAIHGRGGGRRRGSKLNKLEDQEQIVEGCDIYARGHAHHKITDRDTAVGVRFAKSGKPFVQQRRIALVECGSYLRTLEEGVTSYAEVAEYKPVDLGAVFVEIQPFKPKMEGGQRRNEVSLDVRDLIL